MRCCCFVVAMRRCSCSSCRFFVGCGGFVLVCCYYGCCRVALWYMFDILVLWRCCWFVVLIVVVCLSLCFRFLVCLVLLVCVCCVVVGLYVFGVHCVGVVALLLV